MKYMGSKNRISKQLLPIILKDRREGQYFYDLFCGGGNICDKVNGNIVANDYNKYTIGALELIRDNIDEIPKDNLEFTEVDYKDVKGFINKQIGYQGYVGFALSYGVNGLVGDVETKRVSVIMLRNLIEMQLNNHQIYKMLNFYL